jgi:uncharacterized repeat protein (TIGR02543 family)
MKQVSPNRELTNYPIKPTRKRWRQKLAQGALLSVIGLIPLITQAATIQGTVFMDNNNNGVQDAGEPPLTDTNIFIRDNGLANAGQGGFFNTISDANGEYSSISHGTGSFSLWSDIPVGWRQTAPVKGEGFVIYDTEITSSSQTLVVNFGFFNPSQAVSKTVLLTVNAQGTGKGTITGQGLDCGNDCTEEFQTDTKVTLTASPDSLSTFAGWTGGCSGTTSTCSVAMTQAQTVTAKFNLKQFSLIVNTEGKGKVIADGIDCGNDCTQDYSANSLVTLIAEPETGNSFSNWSGGCNTITGTTCQITMNQAQNVTALFNSLPPKTLKVQLQGNGTITSSPNGIQCGTDCEEQYTTNTSITLSATPDTDYVFGNWSGACQGKTPTCLVSMNTDQSVTAVFDYSPTPEYLLTVTNRNQDKGRVTAKGIDCGSDCTESYVEKTLVTLTATPNSDSSFLGWSGACIGMGNCQVTMTQAQNLSASFQSLNQYLLTVNHLGTGNGRITGTGINCGTDCNETLTDGTTITLTAIPDDNSTFIGWGAACSGIDTCQVTMDKVKNVTATFNQITPNEYALTVTKSGTGGGHVKGTGIDCGTDCSETFTDKPVLTLTAHPDADSEFIAWSGGCAGSGRCQFSMAQPQNVNATFNLLATDEYTLTVTPLGKGTGRVTTTGIDCGTDCSENYIQNTPVTLIAQPSADSIFTGWSGACSGTAACQISMTQTQQVTATFEPIAVKAYTLTVQQTGNGNGQITGEGINCGSDCTEQVPENNMILLTATANPGSIFTGWQGGVCSGTNACPVILNTDRTVSAGFEILPPNQYALIVNKIGQGTITAEGIDCGSDCTEQYLENTEITLTATPEPNGSFIGWSGACTGTQPCRLKMNQAQQVSATFQGNDSSVTSQHPLTIKKTGQGTINGLGINCGTDCNESYLENSEISLTAQPDTGFSFTGWQGAGCRGTGICQLTMTQAQTLTATFEPLPIGEVILTITHEGQGKGQVIGQNLKCTTDCTQPYPENTTMLLTATPEADSKFVSWGGACQTTARACRLIMTESKNVIVTFQPIAPPKSVLTVNKQGTGNGSITGIGIDCGFDCTESYAPETQVILTALPDNQATFVGWSGACRGTQPCQLTMSQAQTVTATFNQVNCTYLLEPNSQIHSANAHTGTVKVIAPSECEWQVSADDAWLSSKSSGRGNGSFNYTVAPNPNSSSRNGTLSLGEQHFSVTQTGNLAPIAIFSASPLFGEAPMTVKLDASASTDQEGTAGLTYEWTISDGRTLSGISPEIIFTQAGQYTIDLIVTDASQIASQTFTQNVLVEKANQAPIATFSVTPNSGEAPLQVNLDARDSNDPDGRIINYQWKTSEGQKTLGQSASLTFQEAGTHTITLTLLDNNGLQATAEQTVAVQAPPPGLLPAFTATPTEGEAPLTVRLDASPSSPQSAISQYEWNTTDGQVTSGRTGETFTFNAPGKYLITLFITGQDGTVKSTQKTILVKAKPVARFIAIPNVVKLSSPEVQLDASDSFDADGTVVDYRWTSSDGQTASGKLTSLLFKKEGQYEIELITTDDDGLTSTNIARQTITVEPEDAQLNPLAIIDVDDKEAVLQRTVKLSAKRSRDVDGKIVQYDWRSSDNQKASGEEVSLTFPENGDYTITLTVTDDDGLTAQDENTISVGERVIVEFQGLKPFYEVGETMKVDLIENVKVKSRFDRVDLWVGIQIPNGNVLFKTPLPLKPFDIAPKPFKSSLETINVVHRLLEFEVIEGLGGEYILYALYVREGETPFNEAGYQAVQRSNLASQSTRLAHFANFGLHKSELEALEAVDQVEDVIVEANGRFSFKFDGITHYGQLGQITQGPAPSNGILNLEIIEDSNDDGIPDIRFTYSNGDKQIYYYQGFRE